MAHRTPKKDRKLTRNMVARSMIMAHRSTFMRDRRSKRSKDARRTQQETEY